MSNQEQIERLADLAKTCHQIELNCAAVSKKFVLHGAVHRTLKALRHLEHARMYAGDLLRLAILLKEHRQTGFFDVAAHNGRYTGELQNFENPKDFIQWAKSILRDLFYAVCDACYEADSMMMVPNGARASEWSVYVAQFCQHLKEADQCLGLWLGEIIAAEKASPPSNAKEVPTFPEGGIVQKEGGEVVVPLDKIRRLNWSEKIDSPSNAKEVFPQRIDEADLIESYRGPASHGCHRPLAAMNRADREKMLFEMEQRNKEALFAAIMADLGAPKPIGGAVCFGLGYNDVQGSEEIESAFGYDKKTVEATLRRHLGLPLPTGQAGNPQSAIRNPQS